MTFQVITINTTYFASQGSKVQFHQNFSLGYLVHRSGGYFQENTFKVGFPGVNWKVVTLHRGDASS